VIAKAQPFAHAIGNGHLPIKFWQGLQDNAASMVSVGSQSQLPVAPYKQRLIHGAR